MNEQQERIPPFNTGKLRIGSNYQPPLRSDFTLEERVMQNALLGHRGYTRGQRFFFYIYVVAICGFMLLLSAWGGK